MLKQSLFLLIVVIVVLLGSCSTEAVKNSMPPEVKKNCTSCHLLPKPNDISADSWTNSVLPRMSLYYSWPNNSKFGYANEPFYNKLNKLPMTDSIWSAIVDFYETNGLDSLSIDSVAVLPKQPFFQENVVSVSDSIKGVTAISHDDDGTILLGMGRNLLVADNLFRIRCTMEVESEITQLYHEESWHMVLSGGINPHDKPLGSIYKLSDDLMHRQLIVDELRRPVEMYVSSSDLFISEFGYNYGGLSKVSLGGADTVKSNIHNLPGSYRIKMMNLYGTKDKSMIVTLSQAQEGIYEIVKKGDRHRLRPLLRFEPQYGLSDIAIYDVNSDGLDDILVANGDNADFSIMPKKYHGVRLYVNNGGGDFTMSYEFLTHGATQCRFIEVDGRNGMDFIVSSYFAEVAADAVLVFQSTSNDRLEYQPYAVQGSAMGNWMIMETGDIDMDGDEDVLIGNYSEGPKARSTTNKKGMADLLILTNRLNEK